MSDVDTAQTGASVAPVENTAPPPAQTQEGSASTTEQTTQQQQEQARDEKGRFVPQERVNEITRARREAERALESERALRQQYEHQLAQYQQRQPQPQPPGNEPPSLAAYGYDLDAYEAANKQWIQRQIAEAVAGGFREQETQRTHQQTVSSFEQRSREYAATHPDYEQKLAALDSSVQFRPEVLEAIAISDHGPAVADYLATHLDEADRISRLAPHLAALHLGRIEAQVSAPKPKPVSNAPEPPPQVGGASTAPRGLADELSMSEWMARRQSSLK